MTAYQDLEFFRGCYNLRFGADQRSSEAVLFLHGFPAEQNNKQIDVAQDLSQHFKVDTYLLHYFGLGKSEDGRFSFTRSILDSVSFAHHLLETEGYTKIHLVGHSWGGLVAIDVFKKLNEKRGSLLLLAPFTDLPPGANTQQLAQYFTQLHPHIFPAASLEAVHKDLDFVFEHHHPRRTATQLASEAKTILVVHATEDDVISREMSLSLLDCFGGVRPHYQEIETDHRFFKNRDQLLTTIRDFVGKHL